MSIGFDSSARGSGSGTGLSYNHTCTGSNLILFVGLFAANQKTASQVTYNGVNLTQIDSVAGSSSNITSLWYLVGPTTGTNSVAITMNASSGFIQSCSVSYTGTNQSGQPDNHLSSYSATNSIANAITSVADKSWHMGYFFETSGAHNVGVGAGTTTRSTSDLDMMADNNADITPAGSNTINGSTAGGGLLACCGATFSPFSASVSSLPFKSLMGVGI